MNCTVCRFIVCFLIGFGWASACEPVYKRISPDEPFAKEVSFEKAAEALDASAIWWQKTHKCCHCHSNMMYLVARPSLDAIVPNDGEVRNFFEELVNGRWEKSGLRYDVEALVVATPLAINDSRTTGKLHPTTRKALDRLLTLQWPDGKWTFSKERKNRGGVAGARNAFFMTYEQMLFAAIGLSVAPNDYAKTPAAAEALERIRTTAKKHKPKSRYQKGMLLWASAHLDGLLDEEQRSTLVDELLDQQREDGGWEVQDLVEGGAKFDLSKIKYEPTSDAFSTGFVIYAARQSGVPATDERIQRGVKWLKSNQRESGRWYVTSYNKRPNNVLTYSGTAFAILALEECNELPKPTP